MSPLEGKMKGNLGGGIILCLTRQYKQEKGCRNVGDLSIRIEWSIYIGKLEYLDTWFLLCPKWNSLVGSTLS